MFMDIKGNLINVVGIEEQGHSICILATDICTFFMLEAIASPPYEKVANAMEILVFNPITQNNSIFRSQIIAKALGDGMLVESHAGLEDMVKQLDFQNEILNACQIT